MQKENSRTPGFTLIELLVVILIIGILAAVALPQYQKAVEKSRITQALVLLKTLRQAAQAYHMANGDFPTSFDELSVDIPWTGNEKGIVMGSSIKDTRSNAAWSLQLYNEIDGKVFYITRLGGKYRGGGFAVSMGSGAIGRIVCTERISHGVTFDLNAGDFCERVVGGTYSLSEMSYRQYALP